MVMAAASLLSIVALEFTYVAQINQKVAFDGLDQLKAHYLAKSGLKLSLMRLKAFQHVNNFIQGQAKAAGVNAAAVNALVPKAMLDKIWSFPFFYPIPTEMPGLTLGDKELIKAFEKASGLEGKFAAVIESESSKFNLNSILAAYAAQDPSASASPTPGTPNAQPSGQPSPGPSQAPFNPENARIQLQDFLGSLMAPRMENDPEFADMYRDPNILPDLTDQIVGWADRSYEIKQPKGDIPPKGAPFYSISELHMIPGMDDTLFELFAPNLTVSRTPGINVNTLKEPTLRALFPGITKEEAAEFFKRRDSEEEDGTFKDVDGFFKYAKENFAIYARGDELDRRRKFFTDNQLRFVTDESEFKITVQAQLNNSTRVIEAWVTLSPPDAKKDGAGGANPNGQPPNQPEDNTVLGNAGGNLTPPDSGLKIHFMRVL